MGTRADLVQTHRFDKLSYKESLKRGAAFKPRRPVLFTISF